MADRWGGFTVNLFEDSEGDWVAHFNERPEISAFGPTAEDALHELDVAWQGVVQVHLGDGTQIPAPGRTRTPTKKNETS